MIFILSFIFLINTSFAFTLATNTGASFSNEEVKIYVPSNSTCDQIGLSPEDLLDLSVEAVNTFWNKVSTANIKFIKGGIYQTANSLYQTGILCAEDSSNTCDSLTSVPGEKELLITCNNNATNFPNVNVLGFSGPIKVSNSKISNGVVLINNIVGTDFASLSYNEMRSVLAHEIGHALGLGHSEREEALMYYKNASGIHRLSQDDKDGLTYLYPNKLDGCGSFFGTTEESDKDNGNGDNGFLFSILYGLAIFYLVLIFPKKLTHLVRSRRLLSHS